MPVFYKTIGSVFVGAGHARPAFNHVETSCTKVRVDQAAAATLSDTRLAGRRAVSEWLLLETACQQSRFGTDRTQRIPC